MAKGKTVGWSHAVLWAAFIFTLSFVYAFIRYNIVRGVPFEQVPLYILNKAGAMAATLFIGISFILGPLARFFPKVFVPQLYLRKHYGVMGFAVAAFHAIASLLMFSPAYYPKLFAASGKLTLIGESSMLFGALAFLVFAGISVTSLPPIEQHMHPDQWQFVQRTGYLAFFLVLLHVGIMGYRGWSSPSAYEFGLVPISLIAVMVILLTLVLRVIVMAFPRKDLAK